MGRRIIRHAKHFELGFDFSADSVITNKLLALTTYSSLQTFFTNYQIDHTRFPGEASSSEYFWNDAFVSGTWYSDDAANILIAYYADRSISDFSQHIPDQFTKALTFIQNTGLRAIIPLNTIFYIFKGVMYPTEYLNQGPYSDFGIEGMVVDSDRWTNAKKIKAYIQGQAKKAHSIYIGDIKWELGNEIYFRHTAANYATIIKYYISFIEEIYPNDKFLVSFSHGMVKNEHLNQWNIDLLAALNTSGYLSHVDEFVVHYYPSNLVDYSTFTYTPDGTQSEVEARVEDTFFTADFMTAIKNYFDPYEYAPSFSLTEFNVFEDPTKGYTQLHALLILDCLMKFKAEDGVKSATKHTMTQFLTGTFLQDKDRVQLSALLGDPKIAASSDSTDFPYVSPVSKFAATFMGTIGAVKDSYSVNDGGNKLEILVTKTDAVGRVHILNYSDQISTGYDTSASAGSKVVTYTLDNLFSYTWDEQANTSTGLVGDTYDLPPHSLTVIFDDTMFA